MCDFSFGMMIMLQLMLTAVIYNKGLRYNLQKMMFLFMLYLLLISIVEFFVFYFTDKPAMYLSAADRHP